MLPKNVQVVEKDGSMYWMMKIYDVKSHLKLNFFKNMHFDHFNINEGDRPIYFTVIRCYQAYCSNSLNCSNLKFQP